ncbi:MAG: SDR family oxidoreductase [Anaerolineae bacterium]|nr:SDR family oxidoreductase [Anaerolineae bacterium]
MILIVGATGFLGRETAGLLLAKGEKVRVMARTLSKADDLKQAGAEVVQGDLIDHASLTRACQGVKCVFATAHSLLGRGKYHSKHVDGEGHRALIDAAKKAGVDHFVYVSILGAAPDHPISLWRRKHQIEDYLKASGLSYTILRPPAFMEQHAHLFNGKAILESGKTSILGTGAKPRNFMAARDVAQFAVIALTDSKMRNQILEVGGPQNFTNNQVAELYGKLAGVTPKVSHMPPPIAGLMSILLKPFAPGVSMIMHGASLPDDAFDETFDAAALLKEYPIKLTTLEEFVRERVAEMKEQVPA